MQFDSKQAFDALAVPSLEQVHPELIDFIDDKSEPLDTLEKILVQLSDEELAIASAVIGSFVRWGYGDNPLIELLREDRVVDSNTGTTEPLGEAMVKRIDAYISKVLHLDAKHRTEAKWYFVVSSGALKIVFPHRLSISGMNSYPVASATATDLKKAREIAASSIIQNGVPTSPEQHEHMAKKIAIACSPTIVGGWLNLGLYMVSGWELARRDCVRETGDEKAIPEHKPVDDESIIDCYGFIFDLGPFYIDRIAEVNFQYIGADPEAQKSDMHKFVVTKQHEEIALKLKTKIEPHLAPCGVCGGDYKDHSSDRVFVIGLRRDATPKEAEKHLGQLHHPMAKDGIDGFVFIDSPQHYRIKEPEGSEDENTSANPDPE